MHSDEGNADVSKSIVCLCVSSAGSTAECQTERVDKCPERQGFAVNGVIFETGGPCRLLASHSLISGAGHSPSASRS